jgi:hypothetical protein
MEVMVGMSPSQFLARLEKNVTIRKSRKEPRFSTSLSLFLRRKGVWRQEAHQET